MKTTMERAPHACLFVLAAATLFCITMAFARPAAGESQEKAVSIRDGGKELAVEFLPTKSTFRVGERIGFRIKANKDFFLYLFNINREAGRAVLLIPSEKQKGNRYEANQSYMVPNPNLEFFADSPGREQVVMLASARYLDFRKDRYSKSGDFFTATPEVADEQIKALSLRTEKEDERVVKEVTLQIVERSGRPIAPEPARVEGAGDEEAPMTFISCDREVYRIGQRVRVIYGASRPGWVHIYLLEPSGTRGLYKKAQVDGKSLYELTATAQSPTGPHGLVAVYSDSPDPIDERAPGDKPRFKGLSPQEPEGPPYTMCRFQIRAH